MKNEMTADEFKVGDKVYCAVFGEGRVIAIGTEYGSYPIHVEFSSGTEAYTYDGRLYTYANRTLFFSEPKVEGSVKRPFVSKLVGKRVVINTTEDLCIIGVVNSETSTTLVIDGRHYFKGGIDAIYEVTGGIKDLNTYLVPLQDLRKDWNALTDEDRQKAFESMPDMLEGFLKTWGWLHFAKAIEEICKEKNTKG